MMNDKDFPNLYIIGTAKAATTSLANYLKGHPDIFLSEMKEPHFWAEGFPTPRLGILRCVKEISKYRALYAGGVGCKYRVDASTSYLCSKNAPIGIGKVSGVKIIVILRDPVDRYISHYRNDFSDSVEKRSLMEVIADELKTEVSSYSFFDYGLYAKHLKRWLESLDSQSIMCVDFDELANSSEATLSRLYDFIGLADYLNVGLPQNNSAYVPTNRVTAFLMRMGMLRSVVRALMPAILRKYLRANILFKRGKSVIAQVTECRVRLRIAYAPEMSELRTLLKKVPSVGSFSFIDKYE